jgi:hypothetical protein
LFFLQTGVKGDRYQKGDLWGFENMLGTLLRDEVERVEAMEIVGAAAAATQREKRNEEGASGAGAIPSRGDGFRIEEVPEEVTAELQRTAATATASNRRGGGSGGGGSSPTASYDIEDGFDSGLEAALLEEQAEETNEEAAEEEEEEEDKNTDAQPQQQQQQRHQEGKKEESKTTTKSTNEALKLPGVVGIVDHSASMAPSIKEATLRKNALERQNTARAAADKGQNFALAASSVAEPASALECLAAWKKLSVVEMAGMMMKMSEKERTEMRYEYCEFAPKEGLFPL